MVGGRSLKLARQDVSFVAYLLREPPARVEGGEIFSELLFDNQNPPADLNYVDRRMQVVPFLTKTLQPGDLVITMGAGDVTSVGPELLAALQEREKSRK